MQNPVLDGGSLTVPLLAALSEADQAQVRISPQGRERVRQAAELAARLSAERPIYGRSTGVGANRSTSITPDVAADLRLLRSHATSSGRLLSRSQTRAAMVVRLNQILCGGSGMGPGIIDALHAALTRGLVPTVHRRFGIGTGDLAGLGEIALGLMGEAPLRDETTVALWQPRHGDALPFISSNAVTTGCLALAVARARRWLWHAHRVAALSFIAGRANVETLQHAVHRARPQPGQAHAAHVVRELLEPMPPWAPPRIQDSYGWRAHPQVMGAFSTALDRLQETVEIEMNSAPENPHFDLEQEQVLHNGNFHAAGLALAADQVKIAVVAAAGLSIARLTDLSAPDVTDLAPFLAAGPAGSNGVMLVEYNAAAALAELRQQAHPASLGNSVLSLGAENHSSFAAQAALQLRRSVRAAADVVACELLAARRALSLRGDHLPSDTELGSYLRRCPPPSSTDTDDRSLTADLQALARFIRTTGPREGADHEPEL